MRFLVFISQYCEQCFICIHWYFMLQPWLDLSEHLPSQSSIQWREDRVEHTTAACGGYRLSLWWLLLCCHQQQVILHGGQHSPSCGHCSKIFICSGSPVSSGITKFLDFFCREQCTTWSRIRMCSLSSHSGAEALYFPQRDTKLQLKSDICFFKIFASNWTKLH
jgi:hypothetical protein